MSLLAFAVFLACVPSAILDFALPKWKADDSVRIEDAYKWLHQSTRGGEHAVPSEDGARAWLDNEWKSLGPTQRDEPVWEPLCKSGDIGRINLRPFRDREGDAGLLINAFLASAREYRSDGPEFRTAWTALGSRLKTKQIGKLTHAEWTRLDAAMSAKNYPAVHHSKTYQSANSPAYRILTRAEMLKLNAR